jgi:glycogen(starch) synthase
MIFNLENGIAALAESIHRGYLRPSQSKMMSSVETTKMFSELKHYISKVLCWFRWYEYDVTPDKNVEEVDEGVNSDGEDNDGPWTFEVLWDVVANLADLFTVNGSKNILIGPYRPEKAVDEILEAEFEEDSLPAMAVQVVRDKGFKVITGHWLIHDRPPAIMFHVESARDKFENHYVEMFKKDHNIEIPLGDQEARDVVVFGYMVAEFLAEFELKCRSKGIPTAVSSNDSKQTFHPRELTELLSETPTTEPEATVRTTENEICAQFHDWKCGVGPILLRRWNICITTIFTLKISCLEGKFKTQKKAHEEARQRGIFHRLSTELAAARESHIFTPVSEAVAEQAELVLGKQPDCIITQD